MSQNPIQRGKSLTGKALKDAFDKALAPIKTGPGMLAADQANRVIDSNAPKDRSRAKFFVRITGHTMLSANRWQYDWEEVMLFGTAFITKSGGRNSVTYDKAYNLLEVGNSATGVQGNGVVVENLPQGFAIVAIGTGAIVEITQVTYFSGGQWGYWFSVPNSVDGTCQ